MRGVKIFAQTDTPSRDFACLTKRLRTQAEPLFPRTEKAFPKPSFIDRNARL